VTDTGGGTGTSANFAITVQAATEPPSAAITATPNGGKAPQTIAFNAAGSRDPNRGGSIKEYSFNFGDGSAWVIQKTATASHAYTSAASYIASVTVTDHRAGGTACATVTVKTTQ
jgi:PKD repeat protein